MNDRSCMLTLMNLLPSLRQPLHRSLTLLFSACCCGLAAPRASAQGGFGLVIARQGTGVQVAWNGGILQSAPSLAGPWTSLPAALNPHQVNSLQSKEFFRVQRAFTLTLAKNGTGAGTVRSTALAMVCGAECSRLIPQGTVVSLEAIPDSGSIFAGWTGGGTGTTTRQVTMSAAQTVTATFNTVGTTNPIFNGGFELGTSGWQQQPGDLIISADSLGIAAHSGQNIARLGYMPDGRVLARIGQQVTLPASGPVYLNLALWLYSTELCDVPYYDFFGVYVGNTLVAYNDRLCQGVIGGWQRYTVDLTAYAGQTVPLVFSISSADNLASIALLDDIAISNQQW